MLEITPRSLALLELSIPAGWNFHITTLVAYHVAKANTLSLLGVNYITRLYSRHPYSGKSNFNVRLIPGNKSVRRKRTLKFTNFYQLSVEWQLLDKLNVHPVICHDGTKRVGGGGARCKWMVNISPQPLYPRKEPRYPLYMRLGGSPAPVWKGVEKLAPIGT
jgi:hypothetical protein